ncbi:arginase family protein [Luedemannella flava]|uniref:arginase family protein n=1 Tax=Luedemannella flava TaxID=349316 RepID=UPI0031D2FDF5
MTLLVPYHQDDFLPDLDAALPPATPTTTVTATLPDDVRGWSRLAPLYRAVADAVHSGVRPDAPLSVVSGCCGVSLGVLAGLQRAGVDAGVVWFDAHGDVQTMETSTSGYLGGMPLRVMVGYRPELIASSLGLRAVPESRAVLVDARDLDPPEAEYLRAAAIAVSTVESLAAAALPDGPLLLHVDCDVIRAEELPGLRFPVPGGPSAASLLAAVGRVLDTGRVAALDIACTWDPSAPDPTGAGPRLLADLLTRAADARPPSP